VGRWGRSLSSALREHPVCRIRSTASPGRTAPTARPTPAGRRDTGRHHPAARGRPTRCGLRSARHGLSRPTPHARHRAGHAASRLAAGAPRGAARVARGPVRRNAWRCIRPGAAISQAPIRPRQHPSRSPSGAGAQDLSGAPRLAVHSARPRRRSTYTIKSAAFGCGKCGHPGSESRRVAESRARRPARTARWCPGSRGKDPAP